MKQHTSIWRAAALLPFILVLLFASCDSPVKPDSGALSGTDTVSAVQAGKASVNFSISGGMARTVLPDLSEVDLGDLSYTLTGKYGETEQPIPEFTGSGTTLTLEPGEWLFTLYAENTGDDIILSAKAEVTLAADQSNEVVFVLKPLKEGTGNVNISFVYPAHTGITRVELNSDIPVNSSVILNTGSGTGNYRPLNVPAGDYFTTFAFYRGTEVMPAAVLSETIQVRGGFTSKKTIILSDINLRPGIFIKPEDVEPDAEIVDTLEEKLQWIAANAESDTHYLVEVTTDEAIAPMTLEYSGKTGVSITLTGIGAERTISLSASGTMFSVGSGVTLALENNIILVSGENSLVSIGGGGTLVLNAGAKITDNWHSSSCSVYVGDGTLIMNGGEISENSHGGGVRIGNGTFTMNGGKISGNDGSYHGGGVYISGGTFTMNGGEISGNAAYGLTDYNSDHYGGGVYIGGGTFTMNGGKISENGGNAGGGVYVAGGAFTMSGGEISGNTAPNGGGVMVGGGTFTMDDGVISGNTAESGGGGGVSIVGGGNFTMDGGVISGNTAGNGGGVSVSGSGTFTMDGGVISGNTAGGGGGVSVVDSGNFTKAGGVIYGNEIGAPLANNVSRRGAAINLATTVVPPLWRNNTLGAGDSISTADTNVGWERPEATPLADGWNPGRIEETKREQWFTFTAGAVNHIHIKRGTLSQLAVEVYDSAWQMSSLSGLSTGQMYYIAVWCTASNLGDYEITVNGTIVPPETEVKAIESGWNPGNIETLQEEEWFAFTADAATQYIHVKFGTLKFILVQVYDNTGQAVGYETRLDHAYETYKSLSGLSTGQTYHIKTWWGGFDDGVGTYQIAVNDTSTPPPDSP